MNCHICGNTTDYHCQDCGEPVCEDCCVPFTLQNQIDYTKCQQCEDGDEARYWLENSREQERQEKIEAKKAHRAEIRRKNYWKPENVEKRRLAKIERKSLAIEQQRKMMEEAVKVVGDMFRGM